MEHRYLHEMLPFLKLVEKERQIQLGDYFRTAPLWLLDALQVENVPAGTTFIRENAPADTIIFVGKGKAKATDYRISGVAFDFMKLESNVALGGMEVLMGLRTYQTTWCTETECVLIKISRSKYEKWLFSDFEAFRREAKMTCFSLFKEVRRNRLYLFLQGEERLAFLFVECYEKFNRKGILDFEGRRTGMADETGLCLKTVSRALKKFSDEGLISKRKKQIYINMKQYEALRQIVDGKIDRVWAEKGEGI